MSRRLVRSALAQFTAMTAARNTTAAACAAVTAGVAAMVFTVAPACEMAHRRVDAVLWMCLMIYFVLEWLARLRYMARQGRLSL
jgi:voltage-gated potassium channel